MAYDQFPEYSDESVGSWMLTLFAVSYTHLQLPTN